MKQRIRLTESQLHNVIKSSVKRILREMHNDEQLDMAFQNFKPEFEKMLLNGNYEVDLYTVESDYAIFDFDGETSNGLSYLSAHVDLDFQSDENGYPNIYNVHVHPRIGRGDPLANGEAYEYDIKDPEILQAVEEKCYNYITDYLGLD